MKAFRNRAIYRSVGLPLGEGVDPAIVAERVPRWIECAKGAHARNGGVKPGNDTGRKVALHSPDDVLRSRGVTFDRDPKLWGAYERAVRVEARARYGLTRRRGRPVKEIAV